MDFISSVNESDAELLSIYMLENIIDGIKSHPSIKRRYARYKIHVSFKQSQVEWKGELLSM